jgi:hypothetical protein
MDLKPNATADALRAAQERRTSLRTAMGKLEDALAARAIGREADWATGVVAALAEVDRCMDHHVRHTEGPGGFHDEIVTAAPRLAHAVDTSKREHGAISDLIAELSGVLTTEPVVVEQSRELGTDLLAKLARHRQRGGDLIFEAYETDLGVGD